MGIEEDLQSIFHRQTVPITNGIDVKSDAQLDFVPKTKDTMCYICGAVLFDDKGNVLLIQEAKKSCYGMWYLPAGRLEPRETIIDGVKREVKEEAGLECDLTTLLSVEVASYKWIRFTFLGKVTGGKLKTLEEKDQESLQAKFFSKEELQQSQASLRQTDILKLIDLGRKYREAGPASHTYDTLPVLTPHDKLIHRVVVVDRSASETNMHVLVIKKNENHIPTSLINHNKETSIAVSVYAVLRDAFTSNLNAISLRMCGILGVEHRGTGQNEDGVCITTLVSLDLSDSIPPPSVTSEKYQWQAIKDTSIRQRLGEAAKGKIVPLL